MSHILHTSPVHKTTSLADKGNLHIANLAVHTRLNIYKPKNPLKRSIPEVTLVTQEIRKQYVNNVKLMKQK